LQILSFSIILFIAFVLDTAFGDPAWMPHPVRWIGRAITLLEPPLRRAARPLTAPEQRARGVAMAVLIVGGTYVVTGLSLYITHLLSAYLFYLLNVYIIWMSISPRSLRVEADSVISAMQAGDIESARNRLSRIVGRDTDDLSAEEVYRAVAETVAENTSDGVVAPLFYLAIGGPPLMLAYKAVNTLDSMVGYRNEKYRDFGRASARLDDGANYVPARLTAMIMVVVSFCLGYDWRGARDTVLRDGSNHSSPNAGLPEAAVAGATGVRFGGPVSYGNDAEIKPFIGDGPLEHSPATVASAIRILTFSSFAALMLTGLTRLVLYAVL